MPVFCRRSLGVLIALALVLALPLAAAEKPLTNDDVVTLTKAGLDDDLIVSKIRRSQSHFDVSTEALVKLRKAGVHASVIDAMIRSDDGGGTPAAADHSTSSAEKTSLVKLVTQSDTVGLTSLVGESSSTYIYVSMLFWLNFPGLHATHRTTDRSPSFQLASDAEPRSRYYIVRLDVNDKDSDRSLKMGKSGAFSFRASNMPDTEWTFPFDAAEEKHGVWKLKLRKALPPGEYGVFAVQTNELYDFGVD